MDKLNGTKPDLRYIKDPLDDTHKGVWDQIKLENIRPHYISDEQFEEFRKQMLIFGTDA